MDFFREINIVDTNIFLFFNGLHNSFFDLLMHYTSERLTWVPLYAALLYVIFRTWRWRGIYVAAALILSVAIADQISSGIIKNAVERLRPSHEPSLAGVVHLFEGGRSGRYGFVSSHAANTFAIAQICLLVFRKPLLNLCLWSWAGLNAYSRIYLGVHYPLDILGGAAVGIVVAVLMYRLLLRIFPKINNSTAQDLPVIYLVFAASIAVIMAIS